MKKRIVLILLCCFAFTATACASHENQTIKEASVDDDDNSVDEEKTANDESEDEKHNADEIANVNSTDGSNPTEIASAEEPAQSADDASVPETVSEMFFPESDVRLIEPGDYEGFDLYAIRRGINEIYARHGRIFENAGQKNYFENLDWYEGKYTAAEFDESVFNRYEKENIKILQNELNKLSGGKNVSSLETRATGFLNDFGVNGFVNMRFDSLDTDTVGFYELVYQMSDDSVDEDKLYSCIEKEHGEIFTDISYISGTNLDKFLKKYTGYGLKDADWDLNSTDYIQEMDTFYIEHGDTNYNPVEVELMSINGDDIAIMVYSSYTYTSSPFTMILHDTGKDFQILRIY